MVISGGSANVPAASGPDAQQDKLLSLARLETFLNRYFWLLPLCGFALGWASFVLVHRGEELARAAALLALLGWPWILVEPIIVPYFIGGKNPRLAALLSNFFNQTIQQELFFFTLPFLIAATHLDDPGQMAFTLVIVAAAILSTVDPLYEKYIHRQRIANLAFHALCCFVAALVILPIVVKLPTDQTLLFALAFVVIWLGLVLPGVLRKLVGWKPRLLAVTLMCAIPLTVWLLRASIPATGIVVTHAVMTLEIIDNEPAQEITTLSQTELEAGIYAFAAIRAPNGLAQRIVFRWRHDGWMEEIPALIEGGRAEGFRTYSMKENFMSGSVGRWQVEILTDQGQLLAQLGFTVTD